jgi:type II secretory pathway component GspD/PulD (secretin)
MKKIILLALLISSFLFSSQISLDELVSIFEDEQNIVVDVSPKIKDFDVDFNPDVLEDKNIFKDFFINILYQKNIELKHLRANIYSVRPNEDYNFDVYNSNENDIITPQIFDSHIYTIKNITNEDLETVLDVFGDDFRYKYLPQSNTLIYYCDNVLAERVYTALSAIDVPTKQAQIKVTIMINDNSLLKDFGSNIQNFGLDIDMQKTFNDFFSKGASSSYDSIAFLRFNALVRFMQTAGVTAVEQSPTLLIKNGTKSTLKSVKTVPYLESTTSVQDTKESTTESIRYKDIGLQLTIIPKISKDSIFMNISLISEELLDMNDNKPITQKVEYTNSVYLRDKPVLLTGIIKKSNRSTVVGVPLLKDIPILGHLFKYTSKDDSSQTISILIERI